eukprot:SAG22_NODE_17856_length_297_cov_1.040404_1_plen_36_part_00
MVGTKYGEVWRQLDKARPLKLAFVDRAAVTGAADR